MKFNKDKIKDVGIRALKTFIQAFLGSITINNFMFIDDVNGLKSVFYSTLIAGISAGVSAVWNMIVNSMDNEEV